MCSSDLKYGTCYLVKSLFHAQQAVKKGDELQLPIYKFLREPLVRKFGEAWYHELEEAAEVYLSMDKED